MEREFDLKDYLKENRLIQKSGYFMENGDPNIASIIHYLTGRFPGKEEEIQNFVNNHDEGLDILLTNISDTMSNEEIEQMLEDDFKLYSDEGGENIEEELDLSHQEEYEAWMGEGGEGWNEEYMERVGLIGWMDDVSRIKYEIESTSRSSYGVSGDTLNDLIRDLDVLKNNLENIIENLMGYE